MKKIFTLALAIAAIGSMSAQQEAVKSAKKLSGKLDRLEEARAIINGALENPETANSPEAWFTAGKIEFDAFDANKKENPGQITDEMGYQLINGMNFFDKAGALDNPAKPKFMKDILGKASTHIDDLWGAASEFYNRKKFYPESYTLFSFYGDMEGFIPDSIRGLAMFWGGTAATNANQIEEAAKAFRTARQLGYDKPEAFSYEMAAWQKVGNDDPRYAEARANIDALAREGYAKFGMSQPVFFTNVVNDLVLDEKYADAENMINQAIENTPDNAVLYNLLAFTKGREGNFDGMDKALRSMVACSDVNSELLLDAADKFWRLGTEKNNNIEGNSEADRAAKTQVYNDYVVFSLDLLKKVEAQDPGNKKAANLKGNLEYLGELLGHPAQ